MTITMEIVDNNFLNCPPTEDENNNLRSSPKENDTENSIRNNINGNSKLFSVAELTSSLFLCGASALRGNRLSELGITCLVTAAPELPHLPLPPCVQHQYKVNIKDTIGSDISLHLHRIADILHQVDKTGGKALVHCVAGVSRSASLCLGYLIKYQGMTLREAYHHAHKLRPCIRPNSSFFAQLINFEEEITGNASVSMVHNPAAGGIIPDVYEPDYYNTMRYNSRNFGTK